jgi:DNA-binding transcriptional MocR family regulator
MKIAVDLLEKHLPPKCSMACKPTGGYFIFVTLPMNISSTVAAKYLKEKRDVCVNDGRL